MSSRLESVKRMIKLPVIVGMGGVNAAGRSSGFHSYKRMVCDVLSQEQMASTWRDLANRMGLNTDEILSDDLIAVIKQGTLVRRIEGFNPEQVVFHHKAVSDSTEGKPCSFRIKKGKLSPEFLEAFDVELLDNQEVRITAKDTIDLLIPGHVSLAVTSAGSIPSGFDLNKLYHAHHHPRGLKLTVYGMSDALNSLGFEWRDLFKHIKPDEISVYAGSAISQVDEHSLAGVVGQPLMGNRLNSKMMALSLPEMAADFINSYIINSVGATGHNVGACATFLYNLKLGIQDIQTGRARVVVVGGAEAPVVPEIIEGFRVMGALATDEQLCEIDQSLVPDNRRACRPFSTNAGFTLAEASQFFILMDDALAIEMGATIYGAIAGVYVHADGNKKSIAGPGVGNYVTMAKAVALARTILGDDGLQQTYVQAHGTGTPQNRTTESHILNETAKVFGIQSWRVTAVKSYLGHSVGTAAGDQLLNALGVWAYGWIPGIKTIDHIAEDVHQSHLNILMDHVYVGEQGREIKAVFLNSKGFGGNNATALVLSPHQAMDMLAQKYGQSNIQAYWHKNAVILKNSQSMDSDACDGNERIIYDFGQSVMDESAVTMSRDRVKLSAFDEPIDLPSENPYAGYFNY